MSNVPEGAQVSDDGQWWWDGQAWQPVTPASESGGAESGGAESGAAAGADDRAAAREAEGLPASLDDVTAEQREKYIGEPTMAAYVEVQNEVDVPEIQGGDGEQMA